MKLPKRIQNRTSCQDILVMCQRDKLSIEGDAETMEQYLSNDLVLDVDL